MKMKEQPSYPKTDAGLKKGGGKDASAYKGEMGGKSGASKKSAKLDSMGGVKGKDQSCYKGQE